MPATHLLVPPKKPSFLQSFATCYPSPHSTLEHPTIAPTVYEFHLQHPSLLCEDLPSVLSLSQPAYKRHVIIFLQKNSDSLESLLSQLFFSYTIKSIRPLLTATIKQMTSIIKTKICTRNYSIYNLNFPTSPFS